MMEIDNVLLWLAMEFEKQTNFINEVERKRAINGVTQPGKYKKDERIIKMCPKAISRRNDRKNDKLLSG